MRDLIEGDSTDTSSELRRMKCVDVLGPSGSKHMEFIKKGDPRVNGVSMCEGCLRNKSASGCIINGFKTVEM